MRIYGGDPTRRTSLTMTEGADDVGAFYLQVFPHGSSVVALENNGWSGTVPEIARRASAGGRFLSVHWNVNGLFRVTEAIKGTVTAYFEPSPGAGPVAPDDVVPAWASDIEFTAGPLRATCFALVEVETGVAFERQWCEATLPTYRVPDPDVLLTGVANARTP